MQTDYISREAAISLLHYNTDEACSAVVADFEALPAADVRPVVLTEWVWVMDDEPMCPVCGKLYDTNDDFHAGMWNYCPNCGARMKKGEQNEKTRNEIDPE